MLAAAHAAEMFARTKRLKPLDHYLKLLRKGESRDDGALVAARLSALAAQGCAVTVTRIGG